MKHTASFIACFSFLIYFTNWIFKNDNVKPNLKKLSSEMHYNKTSKQCNVLPILLSGEEK